MQPTTLTCKHCDALTPIVPMNNQAWAAISRCLAGGSPTMAAAELVSLKLASPTEVKAWIAHLRNCVFSWPIDASADHVFKLIDNAFLGLAKPEHFTNFSHCSECKTHDDTLRSKTVKTIGRRDLGNQGWDPINFSSMEGLAYYFPALSRFVVNPALSEDKDPYLIILAPHLSRGRSNNKFLRHCSQEQRAAVSSLIEWISVNERTLHVPSFTARDFVDGWQSWADGAEVWRAG